jgi:hypothetical protein
VKLCNLRAFVLPYINIYFKFAVYINTSVRVRVFNAILLPRSQFGSGMSCDRSTRSRVPVSFLDPSANVELVPKFQVTLHVALPIVTPKCHCNKSLPTSYTGCFKKSFTMALQMLLRGECYENVAYKLSIVQGVSITRGSSRECRVNYDRVIVRIEQ